LSHHFIEVPLRSGQYARWRTVRKDGARRGWDTAAVLTTLVAALCLGAAASAVGTPGALALPAQPPTRGTSPVAVSPSAVHTTISAPTPRASVTSRAAPVARPLLISAFGDSVLLGAQEALRGIARRLDVDAVEGRQPYEVLDDVLAHAKDGTLEPDVVIHAGNNGIISPDQLRATLQALHDRARIVLLNDRVARDWQDPNNATLAEVSKAFPNVVLVDWHGLSAGKHAWLFTDGLHLTPIGARAYAHLIRSALTRPR
jgi:hypothetical protein